MDLGTTSATTATAGAQTLPLEASLHLLRNEHRLTLQANAAEVRRNQKSCILMWMGGGPSHIDTFDPKPKLNELHMQECPESLLKNQRFAFIKGHPNQTASADRYDGFKAALEEAGVSLDEALVQQGYYTYRSGLEASEKLLSLRHPPTAIFASNDDMAAAVVSVAHRRHLDVPQQLTVVGFDDVAAGRQADARAKAPRRTYRRRPARAGQARQP